MPSPIVDTSDIELCEAAKRFLATKTKEMTRRTYRNALRKFRAFYGETIESFITRVEKARHENMDKPVIERERYAEDKVREWIQWLKDKGYSSNTINTSLSAIQNIMQYYQLPISYRFIDKPQPRTLPQNRKHQWSLEEVKEFIGKAEYLRDKAIMLCLFQSGLSIGDLIALNYGDVRRDLEDGTLPLLIDLYRKKTGVDHKTFFGRDAVKYLTLYLESRRPLSDEDPLFTKLGSDERVTNGAIQIMMRRTAEKIDFIDDKDLDNGWNPVRPHSLRAAFNSRLTGKMDRTLIEFFMGHAIGEEKRTYLSMPDNELRELYMNYENLLAVERTSKDELIETKKEITREEYNKLDRRFTELARENRELTDQLNEIQGNYLSVQKEIDELKTVLDDELLEQLKQIKQGKEEN